jgi:hypothetical protein
VKYNSNFVIEFGTYFATLGIAFRHYIASLGISVISPERDTLEIKHHG